MTILYLIIFTIATGVVGGLLYLIYLPFKIRLLEIGKLSRRNSQRINLIYIGFLCLLVVLLFCFRNYRIPSKDRIEEIADVKIPIDYEVIKDEYEDMLQDYCIVFKVRLTKTGEKEFCNSIRNSKYFNTQSSQNRFSTDSTTNAKLSPVYPKWVRTSIGYKFITPQGRRSYLLTFDTINNVIDYQECYD